MYILYTTPSTTRAKKTYTSTEISTDNNRNKDDNTQHKDISVYKCQLNMRKSTLYIVIVSHVCM